ncbi:hypothetical protein, partial [Pseudomonas syringae group genomosp. 7]|uniref:hypothetical protein n=1 Tax=Pseudomonas syringae group genomosp. 7 TaxID=251699 RepID=UPI00376FCD8E
CWGFGVWRGVVGCWGLCVLLGVVVVSIGWWGGFGFFCWWLWRWLGGLCGWVFGWWGAWCCGLFLWCCVGVWVVVWWFWGGFVVFYLGGFVLSGVWGFYSFSRSHPRRVNDVGDARGHTAVLW